MDRLNQVHSLHTSELKALSTSQTKRIDDLAKQNVWPSLLPLCFFAPLCNSVSPIFLQRFLEGNLEKEHANSTRFERALLDLQRKHETIVAELSFLQGNPLAPKYPLRNRPPQLTTLASTSSQTELSIIQEAGKEMIVNESRDYQAELIQMKNEHYEREIEAVRGDNAHLMKLLAEQSEIMQHLKAV